MTVLIVGSLAVACGSGGDDPAPGTSLTGAADPCGLNSGFKGDELCIAPPAAGEGIQIHVGPESYDDTAALEPYVIQPGEEDTRCFIVRPQETGFYYFEQKNRMRSGSHHMLIFLVADQGQAEGPTTACGLGGGGLVGFLQPSQTPSRDFPGADLAPEDAGLAAYVPPGALASFQLHYINNLSEPLVREAWVNLYKVDEADVKQKLQSVFMVGDLSVNVPPLTKQTTTELFTPDMTEPTRVFQLWGHSHAHTESFTVWRNRGAAHDMIYQSFDWAEATTLTFNSVVQNSPPDTAAKIGGGTTGLLTLEPGDQLEWACDVNNTTNAALHFANEAYTAEMCLLAGAYVSESPYVLAGRCAAGSCVTGKPPATN
jgi:hypothetical protein